MTQEIKDWPSSMLRTIRHPSGFVDACRCWRYPTPYFQTRFYKENSIRYNLFSSNHSLASSVSIVYLTIGTGILDHWDSEMSKRVWVTLCSSLLARNLFQTMKTHLRHKLPLNLSIFNQKKFDLSLLFARDKILTIHFNQQHIVNPGIISLPIESLAPGESVTIPLWIRGVGDVGSYSFNFLFYYEPEVSDIRILIIHSKTHLYLAEQRSTAQV